MHGCYFDVIWPSLSKRKKAETKKTKLVLKTEYLPQKKQIYTQWQYKPSKQVKNRFKVNSKETRTTSLTSGVFIINLEHVPHLVLEFVLLTLKR